MGFRGKKKKQKNILENLRGQGGQLARRKGKVDIPNIPCIRCSCTDKKKKRPHNLTSGEH